MAGRLADKMAVVTGAGRGIGAQIARAMAREGAHVIAVDIDEEGANSVARECGGTARRVDVAREEDWQALADLLSRQHSGKLDILVNNAGIECVKPTAEYSLDEWRSLMAINVDGIFLGCRILTGALASAAQARGGSSSVVNISSIAGLVAYPNQLAYNTSKGAVRHLSKSLAIDWPAAGHSIRCNSIHPGFIRTPMLEEVVDEWLETGLLPRDDPWGAVSAMCPIKTLGMPEDIALGAVYLASDEARFVTGIELVIDGGYVAQ